MIVSCFIRRLHNYDPVEPPRVSFLRGCECNGELTPTILWDVADLALLVLRALAVLGFYMRE